MINELLEYLEKKKESFIRKTEAFIEEASVNGYIDGLEEYEKHTSNELNAINKAIGVLQHQDMRSNKLEELRIKLNDLSEDYHECMMGEDAQPEVEAEFQRSIRAIEEQIALLEDEPTQEPTDKLEGFLLDEDLVRKQRAEIRQEILNYYNDDKGMVDYAIQRACERAKREAKEAVRLNNERKMAFMLCHDLLHELWELEKGGILLYDTKATFASTPTKEPGAEAWSLILSTGDALTIYTSPTKPCFVSWIADSYTIREAEIVNVEGRVLSQQDTIQVFMDIAYEFMNAFIANNNIR